LHLGDDMYDSFAEYQTRLLREFDKMVETYGFEVIDASGSIEEVFDDLKERVSRQLNSSVSRIPRTKD
jgi:thymidylate kinase